MRSRLDTNSLLLIVLLFVNHAVRGQGPVPHSDHAKPMVILGEKVTDLDKAIFYIYQAKNNIRWFGSNDRGVYRYDGKSLINFTTKDGLVSDRIRGIQEDTAGNIYVTTYEGISQFDGRTFTTLSAASTDWKKQKNDLWFVGPPDTGTVFRYDGKTLHRLSIPKSKIGEEVAAKFPRSQYPNAIFNPYDVYSIYEDRRGNLWFGTACAGACRFDGTSFGWLYEDHLTNIPGGGSFGIRSILEDASGSFWICNTRHRFRIDAKDAREPDAGHLRSKPEKGIELKSPNGKDHVYFMSAVEDENGALWMASLRYGVWQYERGQVIHHPVKDGMKDISLFSISRDNRGQLWLGTQESGAYRFNGKSFERFRP